MSRQFSTAARYLLTFIWKGTDPVPKYEKMIKDMIAKNPKLAGADVVEIAGQEHVSHSDNVARVSGQIFRDSSRVTSVHAYSDGTVVYSKDSFNESQGK